MSPPPARYALSVWAYIAVMLQPAPRVLDPRHGVHDPTAGTPDRKAGSVRRTSTINCQRPDGLGGHVAVVGRARDLLTAKGGEPRELATVELFADVDYLSGYIVDQIAAAPAVPALSELQGSRASSGFRAQVNALVPDLADAKTPLYLLLDDLPGALLVSGGAMLAGGARRRPAGPVLQHADLCSGWRAGGTLMIELERNGLGLPVTGPTAGDLTTDDPLAWHDAPEPTAHGTQRRRRLDLRADGDLLHADVFFRDSQASASGDVTSIHEYALTVTVDASTMVVIACEAAAHALPWLECNTAPLSASDIVGQRVGELRGWVRTEMTGIRTCTHLNDTLRSLDDIEALSRSLSEPPPTRTRRP